MNFVVAQHSYHSWHEDGMNHFVKNDHSHSHVTMFLEAVVPWLEGQIIIGTKWLAEKSCIITEL